MASKSSNISSKGRAGRPATSERRLQDTAARPLRLVLLSFLVVALILALPIKVPLVVQLLPWFLSLAVLGLPHGAVDLYLPQLVRGSPTRPRSMVLLTVLYLLLVGLVLLLWWFLPAIGFIFFIALTCWHWGTAELATQRLLFADRFLTARWQQLLTVFVRGGLPMLVPLIAFPDDYRLTAEAISGLFSPTAADSLAWAFVPEVRWLVGVGLAAGLVLLHAGTLPEAYRQRQLTHWLRFAAGSLLFGLFFAVIPPILAIGLYFCGYHALSHILRLLLLDPATASQLASRNIRGALISFGRQAAPLTAAALLLLVALAILVPQAVANPLALIALYLALIAALTLPHAAFVAWLDHRQGLWHRNGPTATSTDGALSGHVERANSHV